MSANGAADGESEREGLLPPGDYYYHGTIVKVRYGSGTGVVESGNGRKIPFDAAGCEFVNARSIEDLRVGARVGFDVGWTSRGLRVTRIRVYG